MHNLKNLPSLQRGLSLLEALVALVVAALGVLGVAGIQLRTLSDTQSAVYRSQAIRLIEDLSERLKVQPNALLQVNRGGGSLGYVINEWDTSPTAPSENCTSNWCNPDELATWDIAQWHELVQNTLPAGAGVVFPVQPSSAANSDIYQLGVLLRWRENEHSELTDTDKKNTDASLLKTSSGFQSGTGRPDLDQGCSAAGYSCHLQYITISARCAARRPPGGGPSSHSCPL